MIWRHDPKLPPALFTTWCFNSLLIDERLNLNHVIIKCLFNVVFILACLLEFCLQSLIMYFQSFDVFSLFPDLCPEFSEFSGVLYSFFVVLFCSLCYVPPSSPCSPSSCPIMSSAPCLTIIV